MRNKIVKTILRTTALYMTILTVSMHAEVITANSEQDARVQQNNNIVNTEYREQDAAVGTKDYTHIVDDEKSELVLYELDESRTWGSAGIIADYTTLIDFEGYYGIRIDTAGGKILYSVYKHNNAISEDAQITLYKASYGNNRYGITHTKVKSLGKLKIDTEKELNEKLMPNTVYAVGASFTIDDGTKKPTQEVWGYLYNDGNKITTCRIANQYAQDLEMDIEEWNTLMKDADPDDYLSNAKITYPTSGDNGSCNHVKEWEAISDEIVINDEWTDETKVFAFVNYLSKNVAYDRYRESQPGHPSRANMANNYSDDNNFTLKNNVGVCWDYTNILTIMCRHHGIPCTSVENDVHTFNAVWLHDRWNGIDMVELSRWSCPTKDTDRDNWEKNYSASFMFYGSPSYKRGMETIDQSIWTRERGLGLE